MDENKKSKRLLVLSIIFLITISCIVIGVKIMPDSRVVDSKEYRIGFDARIEANFDNNMILDVYNTTDLVESVLTWRSAFQEETQNYQYYNMLKGNWNFSMILTFRFVWRHNVTEDIYLNFTLSNQDWIDIQGYGNYFYYFETDSCLFITEYFPDYE